MEKKEELEVLMESQREMKAKDMLSEKGLAHLDGLEEAYNILFPIEIAG